jgi:transposase-like protein
LGTWIKKAKRAGAQPLTAEEEADKKEEIRLRKRVRELETKLDILKRFTSYWVRETAP